MRICEVRRFMDDFVVFINQSKDIELLKKDERFALHAYYKEKRGQRKCYGYEFIFKCSNKTLKEARRFTEDILHGVENGR